MIDIIPTECAVYVATTPISIERFISNNVYIKQAACIVEEDTAVIAALTKPIYTQSERAKLIKEIAREVAEQFNLKSVTVTFDGDIFCKIELKTATFSDIKQILAKRNGNYEYIADNRT